MSDEFNAEKIAKATLVVLLTLGVLVGLVYTVWWMIELFITRGVPGAR